MAQAPARSGEPTPAPNQGGTSGPTAASESAKQLLDRLQQQLADNTAQNQASGGDLQAETADVQAIQKAWEDVDKSVQAYEKALDGLERHRDDLKRYAAEKSPVVYNAAKEQKAKLDAIIAEVDQEIGGLRTALAQYEAAIPNQERKHEQAERTATDAQRDFDDRKALPTKADTDLKALDGVQAKLNSAEDESKPAPMYVYLRALEDGLTAINELLTSTDDYRAELIASWRRLVDAKVALRLAAKELADARYDVEKTKAALTRLEQNRSAVILDRFEYGPTPPDTGQPGTSEPSTPTPGYPSTTPTPG
jgi:chromosome segregation ATPase